MLRVPKMYSRKPQVYQVSELKYWVKYLVEKTCQPTRPAFYKYISAIEESLDNKNEKSVPYLLGTIWTRYVFAGGGGQDIYETGLRGGAHLKLKRYERVVFYRFNKRGYVLYKAGRRGGGDWAIKLAGKLYPVLCIFGFNCSVP